MSRLLTAFAPAFLLLFLSERPLSAAESSLNIEFFEKKVRPLLAQSCYECHSASAKKLKAGLRLDHGDLILKGGDSGPAVVAGDPEKSLLIEAVRYTNVDLQMPPKHRLKKADIATLEKWVREGALWPDEPVPESAHRRGFDWKQRRNEFWCWQPIQPQSPPAVQKSGWPLNPIDQFILYKLESESLAPATETDRATWLRRVTFDLIGLPPTTAQLAAFAADQKAGAHERVVDELLRSPHFGERWGRHWLDMMRYAESCGHEFDYTLPHAHEYRDYVIRALNADLPYDQFVTEHIAGDLLPNPRMHPEEQFNESIIGTGSWFLHEAVHAPTDVKQDEADRIDNQIDVFSRSFLGLTVSCSRCHDHKFDAIPTSDYYALSGFLQSSRMDKAMLDPGGKIAVAARQLKALRAREEQRIDATSLKRYLLTAHKVIAGELKAKPEADAKKLPKESKEVVFEDFEAGYEKWKIEGNAFGKAPARGPIKNQQPVSGFLGRGLVNTYPGTDRATGFARSREFTIEQPYINFLIGGGHHKNKTCLNLWVGGKVVHSEVGRGPMDREKLTPRSWDVRAFQGKKAHLEIVDSARGGWGHINVDHIVFSDNQSVPTTPESVPEANVVRIAAAQNLNPSLLQAWIDVLSDKSGKQREHPLYAWHQLVPLDGKGSQLSERFKQLAAEKPKPETSAGPSEKLIADLSTDFDDVYITGEAFGDQSVGGAADSGHLSKRLQGTLRTKNFVLDGPVHILTKGNQGSIRMIIDGYQMEPYNGLLFGGTHIKKVDTRGNWQWLRLGSDMYKGHVAYLEVHDNNDGSLAIRQVVHGNPPPIPAHPIRAELLAQAPPASLDNLADLTARTLVKHPSWLRAHNLLPADSDLTQKIAAIEKSIPTPRRVLAMADGPGEDDYVYIRGNHENLGPETPRRMLLAIAGENQPRFTPGDGSGRLELARRLFDRANPFPSRVMVNRLWHHLFGRGIVPSVDDFGEMGQPPSHPELLDWLAEDFRRDWSIQRAIRQIVLSRTYRMSSRPDNAKAEQADPDNVWLHRMPIRRLQAEAVRDAVLAVSGRLDRKQFGPSVPVNLTSFQQGRGRPGSGPLDGAGRRSLYLSVRRNFLSSFLWTFDFPSPFSAMGKRTVSNVPAQALVMMNDPFVIAESKRWADKLTREIDSPAERIRQAFVQALAKPPTAAQETGIRDFLVRQGKLRGVPADSPELLTDICHMIFNMKTFIYIN